MAEELFAQNSPCRQPETIYCCMATSKNLSLYFIDPLIFEIIWIYTDDLC